jgi:enoyl-CoA hydratase/carnithine racemase
MVECGLIKVDKHSNGIVVVSLDNPPINLQTLELMRQLEETVIHLDEDDRVKAVVLTGNGGKVFSAGSDIKEFPGLKDNIIEGKLRRENAVFTRIERLKKITIAAIDGVALGGGGEIALCCDFRIMDENANIGFPEITLGNFPGSGGLVRLPRLS